MDLERLSRLEILFVWNDLEPETYSDKTQGRYEVVWNKGYLLIVAPAVGH